LALPGTGQCNDHRALRRALKIERIMRKLLERRLRGLLSQKDYGQFLQASQAQSQREAELWLAKVTNPEKRTL
jgi:hypothetical protein